MAKSVKSVKKKGRNRYTYNRNKINKAKKSLKKKHIPKEDAISKNWDKQKSTKANLDDIGLVYDLNAVKMDVDKPSKVKKSTKERRQKAIGQLETEALAEQVTKIKLPHNDVLYCVHMMERYDTDYDAMAKDSKNHYQDTPAQIKRKIAKFKRSFQYNTYLKTKQDVESTG